MTDQQQRTQWALDRLDGFVGDWAPPIMQAQANSPVMADAEVVKRAIRGIAPRGEVENRIGWAVFKREHDTDYDGERPSGFIHTQVGAVFETMTQVENVHQSARKRDPGGYYYICEIRETP